MTRGRREPAWLGYEARCLGLAGVVLPVTVMLGFCAVAGAMFLAGSGPGQIGLRTASGLEQFLPLAAGLGAAFAVADDPALELHLTLKTSYNVTVARRLALALALWCANAYLRWRPDRT